MPEYKPSGLTLFKKNAFGAFRVFPAQRFFFTSNSASSALKTVFVTYAKLLSFFIPLINPCRTNKCTTLTLTSATIRLRRVKMRLRIRNIFNCSKLFFYIYIVFTHLIIPQSIRIKPQASLNNSTIFRPVKKFLINRQYF